MENTERKLPVYAKFSLLIMGTLAFFFTLYIGQGILIPLVFSTLIAILLNPAVNFLCSKKMNRVVAILLTLVVAIGLIMLLVYFIASQVIRFSEAFPGFEERFSLLYNDIVEWVSQTFNISDVKIRTWVNKTKGEGLQKSPMVIGQTIGTIGGMLALVILLPVYIFMILFYKPLLLEFIARMFQHNNHRLVAEVLLETKGLIQNYLVGLSVEAAIVATLNSAGLLIIGLDYAILLGIIGALLNLIPYIGGLVAAGLSMLLALATKSPADALWVLGVFLIVQFIDNNFIVPKIVASRVKINALVSIIVVLTGGALWGIAGMFLSIPLTAIVKVICDRIEPLTPLGFLLGDNQPDIGKQIFKFKVPGKGKKG